MKIRYINSFGAENDRDFFPKRNIDASIDISRFPCISFNVFTGPFPYTGKADLRMTVRDSGGNTISDSTVTVAVNTSTDKLAQIWRLRGSDGTSVGLGEYVASFTVNNGPTMEYRFKVYNSAAVQNAFQDVFCTAPQNNYQPVPDNVRYVGKKGPNVVIYLILCFFLGIFGVHSFYAKNIKKGLLQLVLCGTGISYFWAVFDFIKALIKRRV